MQIVLMTSIAVLGASAAAAGPGEEPARATAFLAEQAEALRPHVETAAARELLDAAGALPDPGERVVHVSPDRSEALRASRFAERAEAEGEGWGEGEGWREIRFDARRFYETFYGSPLASVRMFDLAAGAAGWESFAGKRVLDYGYGSIGQLRLLAEVGATAVGVDVDPVLRELYSEAGDQGVVGAGSLVLLHGRWPDGADESGGVGDGVGDGVGGGEGGRPMREAAEWPGGAEGKFDLFVSKNTLKKGYVTPEVRVDHPLAHIDLGVTPERFLEAVGETLRPGGYVVIYNLGGKPDPRMPMTDIRNPWTREEWDAAGFETLVYEASDLPGARGFFGALGWAEPPYSMDLERGLFASYSIHRKRGARGDADR